MIERRVLIMNLNQILVFYFQKQEFVLLCVACILIIYIQSDLIYLMFDLSSEKPELTQASQTQASQTHAKYW